MKKIILVLLVLIALPLFAESPEEVVSDAYLFSRSSTFILSVEMDIYGDRGDKQRSMDISVSQGEDHYHVLMEVTAPSFLRNMKYLQLVDLHSNSDQQWMKNSRGVRRLSSGNRDDRLFDSDFTVEDLSRLDPDLYSFTEEETKESLVYIHAQPLPGTESNEKILGIDLETGLIREIDIMGDGGGVVREYRVISEAGTGDRLIPLEIRMENLLEGTSTILRVEDYQLEARIPSRMFNRGSL